jgi:16S rRNA (cytosine967-C5)-methyltransferase
MHPKAVLDHCTAMVRELLRFQQPADAVLSQYLRVTKPRLGPRERHTLAETGYAVLRFKPRFEWFARSGYGDQARRMAILGMAFGLPSELDFLNGALGDAEHGWLTHVLHVSDAELMDAHRHNLPVWLAKQLEIELGSADNMHSLAQSLLQQAPLDLRVNVFMEKRAGVLASKEFAATKFTETPLSPMGLRTQGRPNLQLMDAFNNGAVEVQDEGSQLLVLLTDAKRGEMVCDFCAGAGGKTLGLGAAMRNSGRLYAFDVSAHRLDALKPRLARSGLSNVHPVAIANENDARIKRLAGKMDRVLVDAPCSGMGTLRRNPDMKWRQKESDVAELVVKQTAILKSAARLVKPGGRLVYATCSLLSVENEGIAKAFSAQNPDFEVMDVSAILADLKLPTESASGHSLTQNGNLRLWPHLHQTDGFFAAVWRRL